MFDILFLFVLSFAFVIFCLGAIYNWPSDKILTILIILSVVTSIPVSWFASDFRNEARLYDIQVYKDVEIVNKVQLIKSLNGKVMINENHKNIMVNVGNLGQSVKNTKLWEDVVDSINKYNRIIRDYKFALDNPHIGWITKGKIPDSFKELKYIYLNEI